MISVIICTHNPNEDLLAKAIGCIQSQEYSEKYEFFIVDNNSDKPVSDIELIKEHDLKVITEAKQGLTAARECGARNAVGDIIVFVDDDNLLEKNYLAVVHSVFINDRIGVISGTITPTYLKQPQSWFFRCEEMLAIRTFPKSQMYLTTIPVFSRFFPIGAGMAIRKGLLLDYFGSLTEKNRIEGRKGKNLSSGEDLDIDFFAIHKGYLIGVCPELLVKHIIPTERCTMEYLQRLAQSSLASMHQINAKWRPAFGHNVFDFFDTPPHIIALRILIRVFLYPIKRYRIGLIYYLTLAKLSYIARKS